MEEGMGSKTKGEVEREKKSDNFHVQEINKRLPFIRYFLATHKSLFHLVGLQGVGVWPKAPCPGGQCAELTGWLPLRALASQPARRVEYSLPCRLARTLLCKL